MDEAKRRKEMLAAIEAAKRPDGMAAERELYAKTWSEVDSTSFEKDGHYAWMASRVAGYSRVLEIGTGDGRSTLELLRTGHQVVSIDENPACLERAKTRLAAAGYEVDIHMRGHATAANDGYRVQYNQVTVSTTSTTLIEGDTLNDPNLWDWLHSQPPFDAIVCWLMGSHRARQLNVALPREDALRYRLRVQNNLYDTAASLLRSGGILNIVDRGSIGVTPETIELLRCDLVVAHQEQASESPLTVDDDVATRPYESPAGLKMQLSLGTSGFIPKDVVLGLLSTIARKP